MQHPLREENNSLWPGWDRSRQVFFSNRLICINVPSVRAGDRATIAPERNIPMRLTPRPSLRASLFRVLDRVQSAAWARVLAALRAARTKPACPFVRTAFWAAADRSAAVRLRAAVCACFDKALCAAAECPSRWSARSVARARLADVWRFAGSPCPRRQARSALRRVRSEVLPLAGGGRSTPARRACERPMAIACFVERAPCFPSRMWSISSRTNSPACVEADFPSRLSRRARRIVSWSGIVRSSVLFRLAVKSDSVGRFPTGADAVRSIQRQASGLTCAPMRAHN